MEHLTKYFFSKCNSVPECKVSRKISSPEKFPMLLQQHLHVVAHQTVNYFLFSVNHPTDVASHFPEWHELSQLGPAHDFDLLTQQHNSILTEQL